MIIVGTITGTGIFLFVSKVGGLLAKPSLILAAWATGGLIALTGSFCLAELAAAYPKTGGIYIFFRKAFGSFVAFEFGWANLLIMRVGSYSIQALAFAQFTSDLFSLDAQKIQKPLAIGIIGLIAGINMLGIKWGSIIQNILTSIKITSLILIVTVGVMVGAGLLQTHGTIDTGIIIPVTDQSIIVLFGLALISIMWSFGGWEETTFIAEEIKNPEKNLPLSLIGGLMVCVILYLLINTAYLLILSPGEFASSGEHTAVLALERVFGGWGRRVISLLLMVSTFVAVNALILTSARIAYATGCDNIVFHWAAKKNSYTNTPIRGLFIQFVLGSIAIIILNNPYKLLMFTGFAYWLFSSLIPIALIRLRKTDPYINRPFKAWFYPISPFLFLLASILMMIAVINNDIINWKIQEKNLFLNPPTSAMSIVIMGLGAIVFILQRFLKKNQFINEETIKSQSNQL
jgi:basic amino acid/polyamine antiporter, APA family